MFHCEFVTRYILARAASMDVPELGQEQNTATAMYNEAEALWKKLENQFGGKTSHDGIKSELFKTDIRNIAA